MTDEEQRPAPRRREAPRERDREEAPRRRRPPGERPSRPRPRPEEREDREERPRRPEREGHHERERDEQEPEEREERPRRPEREEHHERERDQQERDQQEPEEELPEREQGERAQRGLSTTRLAQSAVAQLQQLTTRDIEAVVGMSRNENGNLTVILEVVESAHFPDSADIMAEYSVEVDPQGDLVGYSRGPRYQRGRPSGK